MNRKDKSKWYELDNAAKIFPPTSTRKDPRVFRFACELYEKVDPVILESAVTKTLKQFPEFQVVLKRGFFWYYLESTHKRPIVKEEKIPPCSPIYRKSSRKLLFRIQYYDKRINLEIYHALADGTGALSFLKTILSYYLSEKYKEEYQHEPIEVGYDASSYEKMDDSFKKYYKKTRNIKHNKKEKVYHFKGERVKKGYLNIVEGQMDVDKVLALAHQHHSTLTSFITAVYVYSIYKNMQETEKEQTVSIMLPVNLRKFFHSASARNFFCTVDIKSTFKKKKIELDDIIKMVNKSFEKELSPKNVEAKMNEYSHLERNFVARLTPLFLKNWVLKIAAYITGKKSTTVVTNLGKIDVPVQYRHHVRLFDVLVSTGKTQMALCSYQNMLVVSFTSAFVDTEVMKEFFRTLTTLGIPVTLVTNPREE
ncbi:MAG: hypothetical protein PHN72_00015 [Bacilli bacterium]|nr:hypothetical protein [Bacilli bacterium]